MSTMTPFCRKTLQSTPWSLLPLEAGIVLSHPVNAMRRPGPPGRRPSASPAGPLTRAVFPKACHDKLSSTLIVESLNWDELGGRREAPGGRPQEGLACPGVAQTRRRFPHPMFEFACHWRGSEPKIRAHVHIFHTFAYQTRPFHRHKATKAPIWEIRQKMKNRHRQFIGAKCAIIWSSTTATDPHRRTTCPTGRHTERNTTQ